VLIDDKWISLLCSSARDASSTLLSGEVSSVIVVIVEVEVFTSVASLDELVIEDLVLLLVVADFGTDADAFLLKKEKRFFCFGGGLVDFAIVVVVDIGSTPSVII